MITFRFKLNFYTYICKNNRSNRMESLQEKIEIADKIIELLFWASIVIISFCSYIIYKTHKIKLPK